MVYRGSRIDDSFNLIPVTTNKYIAEMFGKNQERRQENVEAFYFSERLNEQGISLPTVCTRYRKSYSKSKRCG